MIRGLETITERLGSARCFECSKNQLRKPSLRPFRDNSLTSSDPTLDRAETSLKRSGSPSCFGCTKNELRRFILRPIRDESCFACGLRVDCVWMSCGFRVDCVRAVDWQWELSRCPGQRPHFDTEKTGRIKMRVVCVWNGCYLKILPPSITARDNN